MSYEVLARKWRPQTFDEVVGQDHITRTLKKAVESGRLSHAYLFSGPRGSGKTSTARILAKVIDCANLDGGNPCNTCDSCVGVTEGKNLDVMEIDGASHTGVNEVRDLQESIGYVPSQFENKVYIIDEVHMLSTHAFNALLKTLEEPPPHVYFIFATTLPHKIPDTIKSRCQRHQFKRLEVRDIVDHIEKICLEEKVNFEKDALRLLARKAEGSMRDAQSLLDQCITASSGEVGAQAVRGILGLLDQELILKFLETIGAGDSTAVLRELDAAVRGGVDLEELLNGLIEGFRDLMLLSVPGDLSELVFRSADERESMRRTLHEFELADLVTIVERLCGVSPRLKMASDPRILLESVLVDLALLDRQIEIRDLINRLEGSGSGRGGNPRSSTKGPRLARPAPDGSASSASPADTGRTIRIDAGASAGVAMAPAVGERFGGRQVPDSVIRAASSTRQSPEPVEDIPAKTGDLTSLNYAGQRRLWESFVTVVRQKKVGLGVCLVTGTLESIEDDVVKLRFSKGLSFQIGQVENAANKKFLKGMIKKHFGRDLDIFCVNAGEDERHVPKQSKSTTDGKARKEIKNGIEDNPVVKKIIEEFDGEIIRYRP